jgi:hypothetical protein
VNRVLCLGPVAEHPDRDGVEPRPVALEQLAEAGHVAGLGLADERGVVAHAAIPT